MRLFGAVLAQEMAGESSQADPETPAAGPEEDRGSVGQCNPYL